MPCLGPNDHADHPLRLRQQLNEATRAACELYRHLARRGFTSDLSMETQSWWAYHQRIDAFRRKQEMHETALLHTAPPMPKDPGIVKAEQRSRVAMGDWYAPCCLSDLQQIETAEDLADAQHGHPFAGAWKTLEEALAALTERHLFANEEDYQAALRHADFILLGKKGG